MSRYKLDEQDRYRNIEQIGGGGTASVYTAYDERLQKKVLLKVVQEEELAIQEAAILQNLEHRRIPYLIDCYEYHQKMVLVMQYIEGVTLKQYIAIHGILGEEDIYGYLRALADILSYLHNLKIPILYLDLKPDNLMIGHNKELYLIDFGSARYQYAFNELEELYGTVAYAPCELLESSQVEDVDQRTDIYSFGMIGLYMRSGVSGEDAAHILAKERLREYFVSRKLAYIIRKCTNYDIKKRYQSMKEVKGELNQFKLYTNVGRGLYGILQLFYVMLFSYVAYECANRISTMNLLELHDYGKDIGNMVLWILGLCAYQKIVLQQCWKNKPHQQVTHMMLTGRKAVGLWCILIVLILGIPIVSYGKETLQTSITTETVHVENDNLASNQLVVIQDIYNRNILLRSDTVYETEEDVILTKVANDKTATYQISYDGSCFSKYKNPSIVIRASELQAHGKPLTIWIRKMVYTGLFENPIYQYQKLQIAYKE